MYKPTYDDFRDFKARLNRLFAQLRAEGITARQNFQCCQGCGAAAMPEGKPYAFYHRQDTDSMEEMMGVYIAFSEVPVGERIRELAPVVGLHVTWDGTAAERPLVESEYKHCDAALEELFAQGFDLSTPTDGGQRMRPRCSQCAAIAIAGIACHEQRCPNQQRAGAATWEEDDDA